MAPHTIVWIIALIGMGLIALGFIFVVRQATQPADDARTRKAMHATNVFRRWLFGILALLFIGGSYFTLRQFPIPSQYTPLDVDQVVQVVGRQWAWDIQPSEVFAGSLVEFRVTSIDVNHSFALYGADGRIVTQTQAMPDFINKLVYTFDEPGVYKVLCLEYCGLAHANMAAEITVLAAQGD